VVGYEGRDGDFCAVDVLAGRQLWQKRIGLYDPTTPAGPASREYRWARIRPLDPLTGDPTDAQVARLAGWAALVEDGPRPFHRGPTGAGPATKFPSNLWPYHRTIARELVVVSVGDRADEPDRLIDVVRFMAAYDLAGTERWRRVGSYVPLGEINGRLIVADATPALHALDPATGETRASAPYRASNTPLDANPFYGPGRLEVTEDCIMLLANATERDAKGSFRRDTHEIVAVDRRTLAPLWSRISDGTIATTANAVLHVEDSGWHASAVTALEPRTGVRLSTVDIGSSKCSSRNLSLRPADSFFSRLLVGRR
jgi:hypothetical protein